MLKRYQNKTASDSRTRPNINYIICDDLGYGDVQALAPQTSRILTPHADRLASEGMVFTDAHSGYSVCTPTRYGILTGRYSWRTSLQKGVVQGYAPNLIGKDRPTVASHLKKPWLPYRYTGKVAPQLSVYEPRNK